MKQNDAVFQAICSVLDANGFDGAVSLTKEQRSTVVTMVTEGILASQVDFSPAAKAKYDTDAKVREYTTGMVSNHMRKDKRLNGGEKYEIKNPGSRAKKDPAIESMKLLQAQYEEGSDAWHEIASAIYDRETELNAAKVKTPVINVEALPENLRHLLNK